MRESQSEVLPRRCRQFMAGDWEQLWAEVRNRPLEARAARVDADVGEEAT